MIYGDYYGLDREPFHVTPDPALLLMTQSHQNAAGAIGYGIRDRKGFVVVTGQVGVGKTTILRACLGELAEETHRIVYILNPKLEPEALYATILSSLTGEEIHDHDRALERIQTALLACHQEGVNVVLAIDEAHHMPVSSLESLRLLSNLETERDKLIQIVLVGQPEFDAILADDAMRQLDQRIAVRAVIKPLSPAQAREYIRHRLRVAGWRRQYELFTWMARHYLAWRSRGIPRRLNIYCDNALVNGFGHETRQVGLKVARDAIADIPMPRGSWRGPVLAGLAAIGCVTSLALWSGGGFGSPSAATPRPVAPVVSASPASMSQVLGPQVSAPRPAAPSVQAVLPVPAPVPVTAPVPAFIPAAPPAIAAPVIKTVVVTPLPPKPLPAAAPPVVQHPSPALSSNADILAALRARSERLIEQNGAGADPK